MSTNGDLLTEILTTPIEHERTTCSLDTGISALIVGAGVGGLMTALEGWRKGLSIRILERSPREITTGTLILPFNLIFESVKLSSNKATLLLLDQAPKGHCIIGQNYARRLKRAVTIRGLLIASTPMSSYSARLRRIGFIQWRIEG